MTAKCIKLFDLYDHYNSSFIENAFDKKVIIDRLVPFQFDRTTYVKALSVFSSLYFEMYYTNDKMSAIKNMLKIMEVL